MLYVSVPTRLTPDMHRGFLLCSSTVHMPTQIAKVGCCAHSYDYMLLLLYIHVYSIPVYGRLGRTAHDNTHTHTHTHTHTRKHTQAPTLIQPHTLTRSHTQTATHKPTHRDTYTHSCTVTHSHTHTYR
eukprot:GHVQ01011726.1.p1 GENE.GHVQ01011726.1~~GHVQ01011726.1.p1  ORF type:complete len:128 (+),score=30.42 GHVQ01011726.1:505-888(+)